MRYYKAIIYFDSYEDSYEDGELDRGTSWTETLIADTKEELKQLIIDNTYNKWEDIEQEDINEYDHASEYHTSYLANADNQGDATTSEIEAWKAGKLRLWSIHCHILVSEVTGKKALL